MKYAKKYTVKILYLINKLTKLENFSYFNRSSQINKLPFFSLKRLDLFELLLLLALDLSKHLFSDRHV